MGKDDDKKTYIICIPYAGGSAISYSKWNPIIKDGLVLYPVELAGRGERSNDAFYKSSQEAVDDIFSRIKNIIINHPYVIFGHSMGALLGYKIAVMIKEKGYAMPKHLFLSGMLPPHLKDSIITINDNDDFSLREIILEMGGTSSESFDSHLFQKVFLKILRADFLMLQNCMEMKNINCLPVDLTILHGSDDLILAKGDIKEWIKYSSKVVNFHKFNGDHFYLNHYMNEIIEIISKTIT